MPLKTFSPVSILFHFWICPDQVSTCFISLAVFLPLYMNILPFWFASIFLLRFCLVWGSSRRQVFPSVPSSQAPDLSTARGNHEGCSPLSEALSEQLLVSRDITSPWLLYVAMPCGLSSIFDTSLSGRPWWREEAWELRAPDGWEVDQPIGEGGPLRPEQVHLLYHDQKACSTPAVVPTHSPAFAGHTLCSLLPSSFHSVHSAPSFPPMAFAHVSLWLQCLFFLIPLHPLTYSPSSRHNSNALDLLFRSEPVLWHPGSQKTWCCCSNTNHVGSGNGVNLCIRLHSLLDFKFSRAKPCIMHLCVPSAYCIFKTWIRWTR